VPSLGEEAPVGEDGFVDPGVSGFFQQHGDPFGFVPQPSEERARRLEYPPVDFGVPEVDQALDRFMESEQIAALEHRAEEGRRAGSRCAPQCKHRHESNVSLDASSQDRAAGFGASR